MNFSTNSSPEVLGISTAIYARTDIGIHEIEWLENQFAYHSGFQVMHFISCTFQDDIFQRLAHIITESQSVQGLHLNDTALSCESLFVLAQTLSKAPIVELSYNTGASYFYNEVIMEGILQCPTLQFLDITIESDSGFDALCNGINAGIAINHLAINNIELTHEKVEQLVDAINHNTHLTSINLSHSSISMAELEFLNAGLEHHESLVQLITHPPYSMDHPIIP